MSCAVTYSEPFESFISTAIRTLYVKELRILEKIIETHDAQGDLGNISKVNETCNFMATYGNRLEKQTNPIHHQIAIICKY